MALYSVEDAKIRKQKGVWRPERDAVDIDWEKIAFRPRKRKTRAGKKWIRNAADERAFSEGCWFDEAQAKYVVDWFAQHLVHVVGEWTGEPFDLLPWQQQEIIYPLFGWFRRDDMGRIVRRHRRAFCFLPKKNGKSTLAAGIGLYMMAAEGLHGTQVYCYGTAKDSANIVMDTALQMVSHSDTLQWVYKCKHYHGRIENIDTNQSMRSEPATVALSQGKIGNCAIKDELHAWKTRELWDSLKYLGAAWAEPLDFAITTAGDDKESVCGEVYQRAKDVESGREYDSELMVYIAEADPSDDLTDPEVHRKANPSLGITISPASLARDVQEAKVSHMAWNALKRYRFNIWVHGESPWLNPEDWEACEDEHMRDGLPCAAGLDLARKWDVTSLTVMFSEGEHRHLRGFAWLPEETAQKRKGKVNYLGWAEQGFLTLTSGNVTDYIQVTEDIIRLHERYKFSHLLFDPKYATEMVQNIQNETGVELVEFTQTTANFAGPTKQFEDLVVSQKLHHDGNPLLSWQARHCVVKEDADGNIRPMRPKLGDHRTIDGIVAAIMALGVQPYESYYASGKLEVI